MIPFLANNDSSQDDNQNPQDCQNNQNKIKNEESDDSFDIKEEQNEKLQNWETQFKDNLNQFLNQEKLKGFTQINKRSQSQQDKGLFQIDSLIQNNIQIPLKQVKKEEKQSDMEWVPNKSQYTNNQYKTDMTYNPPKMDMPPPNILLTNQSDPKIQLYKTAHMKQRRGRKRKYQSSYKRLLNYCKSNGDPATDPRDTLLYKSYKVALDKIRACNPLDMKTDQNDVHFESSESTDSRDSDVDDDDDQSLVESITKIQSKFSKHHQESGWTKLPEKNFEPSIDSAFDYPTGPIKEKIKNSSCSGIFQLFFNDEILGKIAKETNSKARKFIEKEKLKVPSKYHLYQSWTDTYVQEIKAMIAIFLYQGIARLPEAIDHWGPDELIKTTVSLYMSKRRFQMLWKFFSCASKEDMYADNLRLSKIAILMKLPEAWRSYYNPMQKITVDECIIPFKGKIKFKTFDCSLPKKQGIKLYCLADCDAYALNCKLYGQNEYLDMTGMLDLDATEKIVMDLIKPLKQKNHQVFMDNFYTHISIAERIWREKQWGFTGSIKASRVPIEMKKIKFSDMKVHDKNIYTKGNLAIILFNDKKKRARNLFLMTNVFSTVNVIKAKTGVRPMPKCFEQFYKYTNSVDNHNQYTSYYRYPHRTKKWWKAVFYQFLEMSVINAWILYKKSYNPKVNQKSFRLFIIEEWLEEYRNFTRNFVKRDDQHQ